MDDEVGGHEVRGGCESGFVGGCTERWVCATVEEKGCCAVVAGDSGDDERGFAGVVLVVEGCAHGDESLDHSCGAEVAPVADCAVEGCVPVSVGEGDVRAFFEEEIEDGVVAEGGSAVGRGLTVSVYRGKISPLVDEKADNVSLLVADGVVERGSAFGADVNVDAVVDE